MATPAQPSNTTDASSPPAPTVQQVVARAKDGFAVDVNVGGFVVSSDLPPGRGGKGSAPPPGNLMRAAIAACLAIGYKTWGEQLGVAIDDVEIELNTEIDMRGQAGTAEVPPGWQKMRWHVRLRSNATEAEVERVLAQAERLSPMLDCIATRCERVRTFEVRRS
ncbi:MAG TPA: OsmC family protein [Polyangiaceae bacterium]|nr:OsmC family protein [Polyangiaceae bacterium]